MQADLRYFSGTGNSYKIISTCNDIFQQNGWTTTLASVTDDAELRGEADLIGFCFPVYAFGIPRICRKYLEALPHFKTRIKTFVLITAGDPDESGFCVKESRSILQRKGLNLTFSEVIHMPSNWTVAMDPPAKEASQLIIEHGVSKAVGVANDLIRGVSRHHRFNYPPRYNKFTFYKDYYLFKWLGVTYLWNSFRVDETCDSCTLCAQLCPTGSIVMEDDKPRWSHSCEQCMRCVNYCPKQAIYQKEGGSIKGRNSYHEPSFKPLKHMKQRT
ncbi:MAG: hypothetical protein D6B25_19310 [Desulfobulbaceae bacterium]|nr:MAG: hypothetical protein D6B25_19310 [Desulfobulbaceae bacterium]